MTVTESTSGLRLSIRNFRGIREAFWNPEGVCALVGPNATGKSTLLEAFLFLHYAAKRTPKDAILVTGGMQAFMHHRPIMDTPGDPESLAKVTLRVEAEGHSWTLSFSATNDNISASYDETFHVDGSVSLKGSGLIDEASQLANSRFSQDVAFQRLKKRLLSLSLYRAWEIQQFRKHPYSDRTLDDMVLAPDGSNVFTVLQNWRDSESSDGWRFNWVRNTLQRIHPRSVGRFELKPATGLLGAVLFAPSSETPLPIKSASNGIIGTLLSLTAVAGGRDGGIVLLDEPDNGLHPFAIQQLVTAFRELHDERNVHVVLATHSPVVLNAFSDDPEDVWVTDNKPDRTFPVRLTNLRDPEWLANFRLGNLYGTGFGRQDPLSGNDSD